MTDDTMPFFAALLKRGGGDYMKDLAEEVLGRLMAYDVEARSVRVGTSATKSARPNATAIATVPSTRGWGRSI